MNLSMVLACLVYGPQSEHCIGTKTTTIITQGSGSTHTVQEPSTDTIQESLPNRTTDEPSLDTIQEPLPSVTTDEPSLDTIQEPLTNGTIDKPDAPECNYCKTYQLEDGSTVELTVTDLNMDYNTSRAKCAEQGKELYFPKTEGDYKKWAEYNDYVDSLNETYDEAEAWYPMIRKQKEYLYEPDLQHHDEYYQKRLDSLPPLIDPLVCHGYSYDNHGKYRTYERHCNETIGKFGICSKIADDFISQ